MSWSLRGQFALGFGAAPPQLQHKQMVGATLPGGWGEVREVSLRGDFRPAALSYARRGASQYQRLRTCPSRACLFDPLSLRRCVQANAFLVIETIMIWASVDFRVSGLPCLKSTKKTKIKQK